MASGETSEPPKRQTCVLRVPIHCEGCKKKVKKVLSKIEGVHETEIDSKQNKVTITCSIDADTIIKKLIKSGKQAELWPEKKPTTPNPKQVTSNPTNIHDQKKNKAVPNPDEVIPDKKPTVLEDKAAASEAKPAEAPKIEEPTKAEVAAAEVVAPKSSSTSVEPAESKNEDISSSENTSHGKKEKKVQKESSEGAISGEATPPHGRVYEHVVHQPQPVYAYNMVGPATSHSIYAPAAEAMRAYEPRGYSYYEPSYSAYSYEHQLNHYSSQPQAAESYYSPYSAYPPPEAYYREQAAPPSRESYDLFSDENPNSCKVM